MTTGIYGRYIHLFDYVTNFSLEMSLLVQLNIDYPNIDYPNIQLSGTPVGSRRAIFFFFFFFFFLRTTLLY